MAFEEQPYSMKLSLKVSISFQSINNINQISKTPMNIKEQLTINKITIKNYFIN